MSKFISTETRVQGLQCAEPWKQLDDKEKNYAYFMSMASWAGSKMVFHQLSYEAPALFLIFQAYFQEKDFFKTEQAALAKGIKAEDYKKFIAYVGGFYGNFANYHNFGDNKFIPDLSRDTFRTIILSNPLYNEDGSFYREVIDELYPQVEEEIFNIEKPFTQLGFPDEGGVTGYFSRNMTKDDLALVQRFLLAQGVDILNTRAFKVGEKYVVTVGSIDTYKSKDNISFEGKTFYLKYGEFKPYLEEAQMYLKEAYKYCANETQEKMVHKYIEHLQTGDIEAHKDSQREWVKDKGPVVETNLGWIESYIDPENTRAYWEGMVAIVDKEKSKKFQALVTNSEKIIPQLPWPKYMEKEKFLAPDFTTLEVITFASNGCPIGINIPNYDDIREKEGFKNVYLGNAMPTITIKNVQFATPEQAKILAEQTNRCDIVQTACHELLGHGVGKLNYEMRKYTDPITGEEFESCYEEGDTWNSRFGGISASYEECRADTCANYLCSLKDVYSLFGFEDHEKDMLLWVNVMNQIRYGLLGLGLYNPEAKKWGQAHTQGAFVFAMWIYRNQKSKVVDFEIVGDDEDFRIHLDEKLVVTEGRELIEKLLMVIQTYKSSGAVDRGTAFYNDYSSVNDYFLRVRDIILKKKKPRRLEVNNNLFRYSGSQIDVKTYPESFEGIILSFADRFKFTKSLYNQVLSVWDEHKACLRVTQDEHKTPEVDNHASGKFKDELIQTCKDICAPCKGILAADESTGTIGKRFANINVENNHENRQAYRELLFTTPDLEKFISGVIMFDETVRDSTKDGKKFCDVLRSKGIHCGIKVDTGLQVIGGTNDESATQGLDGLGKRCAEYYQMGCRFAKWRAVLKIGDGLPSQTSIEETAVVLARYGSICQQNGLAPIIEPEILQDGEHDIDVCAEVSERVFSAVMKELFSQRLLIEGLLLKPNMVTPGASCPKRSNPEEIAWYTVRTLSRTIVGALPGVVFLSGGQSEEEASLNLNAMNKLQGVPKPWTLTFSYGRALQTSVLKAWQGKKENVSLAQLTLLGRAKANGLASVGKYSGGTGSTQSDFVANYKY